MRIDDPAALDRLIQRLQALRADSRRRWGKMSVAEMLCHLGDGNDFLRGTRQNPVTDTGGSRPVLKWIALYSPFRWARGAPTDPSVDPQAEGTRPVEFEADRDRVIEGLRAVADQAVDLFPSRHPLFGPMSAKDWYRSVYRHYDHHLRQFGV